MDKTQLQNTPEKELCCDECGREGAHEFGDIKLCVDCYQQHGSCCPEFGQKESCE